MPHRRVQEREQVLSEIQREDLQTGKNDRSSGKSAVRQHILRIRIRGGSIESQKGKRKTEKKQLRRTERRPAPHKYIHKSGL